MHFSCIFAVRPCHIHKVISPHLFELFTKLFQYSKAHELFSNHRLCQVAPKLQSRSHIFEFLGVTNIDIVSSRFYKKGEVAFVTLGNIDKITLLSHYYRSPVTFSIEPVEKKKDTLVETFYSTSCKHALGISKYSSTTLAMGELGRYPIQHRIILLTTMYWLRLEHGTKNALLNLAYQTMKNENHHWCKNIEYYFWKIGYRNMWLNPEKWSKNTLKLSVKRRLQCPLKMSVLS